MSTFRSVSKHVVVVVLAIVATVVALNLLEVALLHVGVPQLAVDAGFFTIFIAALAWIVYRETKKARERAEAPPEVPVPGAKPGDDVMILNLTRDAQACRLALALADAVYRDDPGTAQAIQHRVRNARRKRLADLLDEGGE